MAKIYKYHLRKSSKKEICPSCGHRTFVPYVDAAEVMAGYKYGRCDREQKCGYICYPRGIETHAVSPAGAPAETKPRLYFYPSVYTLGRAAKYSNLYLYALATFNRTKTLTKISKMFNAYKIRSYRDYVIYPQISIDGEYRTAKCIKYNADGHRLHNAGATNWLHTMHVDNIDLMHNHGQLCQCFFGEHLLNADNYRDIYNKDITQDTDIYVVEAEKTAVLMSICSQSDGVWLACGGSQMLKNAERNKVLEGRKVTLIPDQGQFWAWKSIADKYGWEIISSIESFGERLQGVDNPPITIGWDVWDVCEWLINYKR